VLYAGSENQAGKIPETKRVLIFCFNRELLQRLIIARRLLSPHD